MSSSLLSKIIKNKIYGTVILPVLFGRETCSLTWREERRLRVFEKRALRRIFGPKGDEVTREWIQLHNEKLNDLYTLLNIIRVIKSRRMRWAVHVARLGEGRIVYRWVNLREIDHLADPGVDGRIIVRRIFRTWEGFSWTGLVWLRLWTGDGLL